MVMKMICEDSYHFKCPNTSDPNLELALNSLDALEIDTFPPATSCRFSPEEEEFLSHTDSVTARWIVSFDICTKFCQCDTAYDSLVWLTSSVAP